MSRLYPQLFGSCTQMVMCPNCCTLQGPVARDSWVTQGMAVRALRVTYWGPRHHGENMMLLFVSFKPGAYEMVVRRHAASVQKHKVQN
jgi:hypothetical protein